MQCKIGQTVLELVEGDISELDTECIVNAANEWLAHGGGVAGVISHRGGPAIQRESSEWVRLHGPVKTGSAAITSGGDLKARYVIHAVGPRQGEGDEDRKLKDATRNSLKLATEHDLRSIGFPAISTGIFGYPLDKCATIMLSTTIQYLKTAQTSLDKVIFCLYDARALDTFAAELQQQLPENL